MTQSTCARLDAEWYENQKAAVFIRENLLPVKAHIKGHPACSAPLIRSGTVILLDAAGKERVRLEGYLSNGFMAALKMALAASPSCRRNMPMPKLRALAADECQRSVSAHQLQFQASLEISARIAVCSAAATEAYGSQQTNGSAEDSLTVTSHLSALNGAEPSGVVSAKPNNLRVALAD